MGFSYSRPDFNIPSQSSPTIALKQQEIEKLKEYKGSLINGVVTGKVKII